MVRQKDVIKKVSFTTRMDATKIKQLKYLGIDLGRSAGDLLAEGIDYLLKKYKKSN